MVGANNSGKTTLLRALNSVLGITRSQINQDDLFVDKEGNKSSNEITIDVRIISVDENGVQIKHFDSKWSSKLGVGIQTDDENEFFAFRTKYLFGIDDVPTISYYLFSNWDNEQLKDDEFKGMNQLRNNIKMFFIDAQRDILEDSKQFDNLGLKTEYTIIDITKHNISDTKDARYFFRVQWDTHIYKANPCLEDCLKNNTNSLLLTF